jgi:hypothetical protein
MMNSINSLNSASLKINTLGHAIPEAGERTVTARFKNPTRMASIAVPDTAWHAVTLAPVQYREVLIAVLDNAAKRILSKQLAAFSVWPSTIDSGYFCEAALLEEASGANSEWMGKDELETAWRDSETRKAWVSSPNYAGNIAFRKAVAHYETLILKLAGKSSQYTPADMDLILAKLKDSDVGTELGAFVVRRIEALRNKPTPVGIDCDLL